MFDQFNINPTQLIGMLSFAAASIACLIATRRSGFRDARVWKVLALTYCLFLLEVFIGLRHRIHDLVNDLLMADNLYNERSGMQETIIISLATVALMLVMLVVLWRQFAGSAARVAAGITIAVLALFAIETVSLHALDAIFYRPTGPVLMIGWIWLAAAAGICLAATQR